MRRFLFPLAALLTLGSLSCGGSKDNTTPTPTAPTPKVLTTIRVTLVDSVLVVGKTTQATAATLDQFGAAMSGKIVTWRSTDSTIASVQQTGIVLALKDGAVSIQATADTKQGSANLRALFVPVLTTVRVTLVDSVLVVGKTTQATAATLDQLGAAMSGKIVTWRSTDSTIASVQQTGIVLALKEGAVSIQATADTKQGSANLRALSRVYTNYLQPSYVTHNMGRWLSGDDLLTNGLQDKSQDPLGVIQTAQLDIDGDGLDDVLTFDSYPMGTGAAIPLPVPPRQFIARGDKLHYVVWQGPTLRQPHGVKLLVGDFNGDSLPDVFSLVGFDPPNGTFPVLRDFNHVLFNSKSGFKDVWEFDDQLGFWITGASGDIDGDGDLDVVAFNFHVQGNGVPSRILWNDGKGHFTSDPSGIGFIRTVDASELVDVNGDGVLDLVISNVIADPVSRVPSLTIMWGNRGGFSLSRSVSVTYGSKTHATDLSFFDVNKDGIQDILLTYSDESGNYGVQVFLVLDAGTRLSDATSSYVDTAVGTRRFDRARLQDVDGNGLIDLIGVDRRSGVRWEWNGSRFIKRF